MTIKIHSDDANISLWLPTRLLFSKTILCLGLRIGQMYVEQIPNIPPEAVGALCKEIRRIKRTRGSWELLNVETSDGEHIQITL